MTDYKTFFSGKKITLMGLGLLGRGVGDAKFLAKHCQELIVTDLKTEKELKTAIKKLKFQNPNFKKIRLHLGGHKLADFRNRDLIIKGAGVPLQSGYLDEARKNNIPVLMSTALFAKSAMEMGAKIIGITGTRGKSTTTQAIYEILKQSQKRTWLGGNVQGVSTLALLPEIKAGDWVVLELDSWQLQGFGDLQISPNISVFTNFLPDHLNYYNGDMKQYFADKANIFKYQDKSAGDRLFWGGQVADLPRGWQVRLPGRHNRRNLALAVAVARELAVPAKLIRPVIASFAGVAGRLELVRVWRGLKIYNDTTATTPDATLVALQALGRGSGQNQKLTLIMGGADKSLDMSELLKNLPKFCKKVILLPGTGTDKVKSQIKNKILVKNLEEAIKKALNECERGGILLFSPAFASFGLFKNEFDRGEKFNKLVKKLK